MTTPQNKRPLSPHLEVYRLPLTGIVSITHRMTGVLLAGGLLLFVWSLLLIAEGGAAYATMQSFINHWFITLIIWGMIYSLFFHLCHGVRHLLWDAGFGFDKDAMDKNVLLELKISAVLTLLALFIF